MTDNSSAVSAGVYRPEGAITAANADAFRKALLALVEQGHVHIEIDLSNVDLIDSRGLGVFVVCHQTLVDKGGSLSVTGANKDLRGLFHVMRLDEHFSVSA